MKYFILTGLIFSTSAFASLEGSYTLLKGPEACPSGVLAIKSDPKSASRYLVFGASQSWTLNAEDNGTTEEKAEGGCTYKTNYKKSENQFTVKTLRESCPVKNENSEINETMVLTDKTLVYKNEVTGKNTGYECRYKKN